MRILELKSLKDKVLSNKLFEFVGKFEVVKCNDLFINLLTKNKDFGSILDAINYQLITFT